MLSKGATAQLTSKPARAAPKLSPPAPLNRSMILAVVRMRFMAVGMCVLWRP